VSAAIAEHPFATFEGQRFDLLMADPPWRFTSNSQDKPGRNARGHYDCMKIDEIAALPVRDLAATKAMLLLWTTVPFAELAFKVVAAWGFKYKSQLAWDKERKGTGFWARNEHELLYICTRGGFPCPRPAPFNYSMIRGQRREHSRKPDQIYCDVEAAFPATRKVELFARETRPGWSSWGNEASKFDGEKLERQAGAHPANPPTERK
jgi:N6-adenosine-specific RNA methylase IME4